ncbi:MAG TPA: L-threonylcarbamoyladenylate synthase [Actinomycetota bacterium]|nr:L-threonylcarbamoyladenylate synthase [Actinomycetota bacterium]
MFSLPSGPGLEAAERAMAAGGLVVFPTDTVYGVAARPELTPATARLFDAKGRPRTLTLPVLAAALEQARTVAVFDARAEVLAERFWPGGLTIVLPRTERAAGWDLGDEGATVGVRVPAHEGALALLRRTGPLAVTSANRSGEPTPTTCEGVRQALGDAVAVYLCGGSTSNAASTVVDLTGGQPRILRHGTLPGNEVLAAAAAA